ncbi:hypothetical protein CC1G_10541 [Coprinopsis cinerea okayama7|uniref:BRCT domain-containing protein n=1 Tax=Coprinopsis cinerea (strain Okayama-7 / 130 / ATCC MYA-4618 / FGSC 9003) TaxID=240176 RepID=A8N1C0_COPC7|nr:hypothetical protein CC1G_10541 [Coprinopsis cinerea okayama7\|eukprot:XP_001828669.2 hypothetical protein CC1G_10541 [Coprinopsis cinerea okayama7\
MDPSASSRSIPRLELFKKPDGTPIKFFSQADVSNHPRLVRQLKNGGGQIGSIRDADIILVNQNSSAGQHFLGVWRDDPGKVILHYSWVQSCLDARKLLQQEDNWGGWLAEVKNISEGDEDESGNEGEAPADKSVEFPESVAPETDVSRIRSDPKPSGVIPHSGLISTSQPPAATPAQTHPATSSMTALKPTPNPVHSNHLIMPVPSDSTFPSIGNTQMMFQPGQYPQFGASGSELPSFLGDSAMDGQQPVFNAQLEAEQFLARHPRVHPTVMADVLEANGDPASRMIAAAMRARAPPTNGSSGPDNSHHASSSFVASSRSPSEEPLSAIHKKKQREASSSSAQRKLGLFSRNGAPISFFIQIDHAKRNSLVQIVKTRGGTIVADVKEADFAILYSAAPHKMKDYERFLKAAQAHNVPAVRGHFVEHCDRQEKLLDHTEFLCEIPPKKKRKKPVAVSSSESEDEQPISKVTTLAKKKAQLERKGKGREKEKEEKRENKEKMESTVIQAKKMKQTMSPVPARMSPPKHRRAPKRFTEQEIQQALKIALDVYSQDPDTTHTSLMKQIHAQLPDHPERSWSTTLTTKYKRELEEALKRGGINYRKRQRQLQEQQAGHSRGPSLETNPSRMSVDSFHTPRPSFSPVPVTQNHARSASHASTMLEQDLEVIATFFALGEDQDFGEGDERNEHRDAIFQTLERKRGRCRTLPTWDAFHAAHAEEIQRRVNLKVEQPT